MITKPLAIAITLGLAAAFATPGVRHVLPAKYRAKDSFPISTFTMFTLQRPEEHRMTWVRGLDAAGESLGHIPSWRFNPGGLNQAMAHLKQARRNHAERRDAVCQEIAQRITKFRSLRKVVTV